MSRAKKILGIDEVVGKEDKLMKDQLAFLKALHKDLDNSLSSLVKLANFNKMNQVETLMSPDAEDFADSIKKMAGDLGKAIEREI